VQNIKSEIDQARAEEEKATRDGDLNLASEIKYSRIPELEKRLEEAEESLKQKQEEGAILKEEVTSEEIAEVVSS
jgi:ATP-dependent Clp protease ATP-binding subunit ClpB